MSITQWELGRTVIGQKDIQILLCDDDPEFLQTLRAEIIRAFKKLNMSAAFTVFSSPAAITQEAFARCELAFLDIDFDFEEQTGIDVARSLRQVNSKALIFFVTNYIDYAPTGYEVQAFRYVLKRDVSQVLERYILQAMELFAEGQEFLRVQTKDSRIDIPLGDIAFLEVMDHSVSIHTASQSYELNTTLSALEDRLEQHGFLRIHKSFLVNMHYIRKFRSRECLLTNGTTLAVSGRNYSQQKQKYLLWKGLK